MNIGDTVSDFTLPITGAAADQPFKLSEHGRIIVLYFYPKDDTPGCTIESNDFSQMLDDFKQAGATVLGISADNMTSHDDFRAKFNYQHHLLADTDKIVCEQFNVLNDKGHISRSTFVIDTQQCLRHQWRDIKNVNGHAAEVLACLHRMA